MTHPLPIPNELLSSVLSRLVLRKIYHLAKTNELARDVYARRVAILNGKLKRKLEKVLRRTDQRGQYWGFELPELVFNGASFSDGDHRYRDVNQYCHEEDRLDQDEVPEGEEWSCNYFEQLTGSRHWVLLSTWIDLFGEDFVLRIQEDNPTWLIKMREADRMTKWQSYGGEGWYEWRFQVHYNRGHDAEIEYTYRYDGCCVEPERFEARLVRSGDRFVTTAQKIGKGACKEPEEEDLDEATRRALEIEYPYLYHMNRSEAVARRLAQGLL